VAAVPVPERPELVAQEGEHGGHGGGDRDGGEGAETHPVVQRVGTADGDDEREDADHAELGYLVYQNPESRVEIAEEIHSLLSFAVHPVIDRPYRAPRWCHVLVGKPFGKCHTLQVA
jgi:hypothetical protein